MFSTEVYENAQNERAAQDMDGRNRSGGRPAGVRSGAYLHDVTLPGDVSGTGVGITCPSPGPSSSSCGAWCLLPVTQGVQTLAVLSQQW